MNKAILNEIFKLCIEQNDYTEMKGYFVQNTRVIDKKTVSEYSSFQKKIK